MWTKAPTDKPTEYPTQSPTHLPTNKPTGEPTASSAAKSREFFEGAAIPDVKTTDVMKSEIIESSEAWCAGLSPSVAIVLSIATFLFCLL